MKNKIIGYVAVGVCFTLLGFLAYVWVDIAIPQIAEVLTNVVLLGG